MEAFVVINFIENLRLVDIDGDVGKNYLSISYASAFFSRSHFGTFDDNFEYFQSLCFWFKTNFNGNFLLLLTEKIFTFAYLSVHRKTRILH